MTTEPRVASHKHVLRLDRNIELYTDSGLDGCRTGIFPEIWQLPADIVVECITFCTDQEQSQSTGGEFIRAPEPEGFGCTWGAVVG